MENRVKERLTGAIILIAAMVILVPEMFSGHRKPAADPLSAAPHSASDGPPLRSYTMDLGTHGDNGSARSANQASLGTTTPGTAAPPPAEAAPAVPQVVAQPVEQLAPAPAAPAPRTQAAAAASSWYVQVGSFSKAENAQRYAREISGKGFAARVDPGNGKLLRVRVGPVADREAALQLKAQLAARGYNGALTNP